MPTLWTSNALTGAFARRLTVWNKSSIWTSEAAVIDKRYGIRIEASYKKVYKSESVLEINLIL